MSIQKSHYAASLQAALEKVRQWTAIDKWSCIKTVQENPTIRMWQYEDIIKVEVQWDQKPAWTINDWRSLLATDGSQGVSQMVERRRMMVRLDEHTRVNQVQMKEAWRFGSHDRIWIEHIVHQPMSLRYISIDHIMQSTLCLDVQCSTNQPDHPYHVTLYCQSGSGSVSESYILSLITESLAFLSSHASPPFVSRQDSGIRLHHNHYDPSTNTLDIQYQYTVPNTTRAIHIHRHLSSPIQSRSWDPQEPAMPLSLRSHDFMSSSLVFRPSSPGRAITSQSTSPSSLDIVKGDQLVIDLPHSGTAQLTLQVDDHTLTDPFAQLCLRCVKHDANWYSLILHHPASLLQDLKLPTTTSSLSVKLAMVLEEGNEEMQLLTNGKQWPIRSTLPWDVMNDDDSDEGDDEEEERDDSFGNREANRGNIEDADDDGMDPFMDSMEDIHDTPQRQVTSSAQEMPKNDQPSFYQRKSPTQISLPPMKASSSPPLKIALSPPMKATSPISTESPINSREVTSSHSMIATSADSSQQLLLQQQQQQQRQEEKGEVEAEKEKEKHLVKPSRPQRPPSSGKKINIPHVDPPEVLKAYQYFDALLHSNDWQTIQKPDQNNGFATVMKMDVDGHPTGALLCETTWPHCSIWDAKAVLTCSETREIWDTMFDKSEFICSATPSCSIWHTKLKSAWPASPRDYVAFTSQYTSDHRVDICSTSCIDNTYEHHTLPKETSDFVRATLDLSGWRLDRIDDTATNTPSSSISVRYVLQTHFQGWIPWYLLNQLTTQAPNVPTSAYQYLKKYGAPPCVEDLVMAILQQIRYDHTRKSWRCEYTRSIVSGELGPTQSTIRLDRRRWACPAGDSSSHYNITVDPPPSRVTAEARKNDPYGVWLVIEHDESFIIPQRAKLLVLIKPGKEEKQQLSQSQQEQQQLQQKKQDQQEKKKKRRRTVTLMVNGTLTPIQNDTLDALDADDQETTVAARPIPSSTAHPSPSSSPSSSTMATTSLSTSPSPTTLRTTTTSTRSPPIEEYPIEHHLQRLTVTPMKQAQAAFLYMKKLDEPFGWTVVSDKQGLRVNKRPGTKLSTSSAASGVNTSTVKASTKSTMSAHSSASSSPATPSLVHDEKGNHKKSLSEQQYYLDVPDPYMIYKASKVIENFSMEEVASVVTNVTSVRVAYDSSIEKCEIVQHPLERGCQVIRQEIKGIFPFKSRELFLTSCMAVEKTVGASSSKRILYVESSLDIPTLKSSKLPRGKIYISGWILEPIDPYTTATNHPIPSMRATYMLALDLGGMPSYLSNMSASGTASKKLQWVEQYLKQHGPLPYLVHPLPAIGLRKNQYVDVDSILLEDGSKKENGNALDATSAAFNTASTPTRTLRWINIETVYDQQMFLVKSLCQYQQTTPLIAPKPVAPFPFTLTSTEPTWMDRRHSTTSSIHSTHPQRRGSMPPHTSTSTTAATTVKQRKTVEFETESTLTRMMMDPVLCELVVDLQTYPRGYEINVQFRQHPVNDNEYVDEDGSQQQQQQQQQRQQQQEEQQKEKEDKMTDQHDENDLSGLLSVIVSEVTPTPSHLLLKGTSALPGKHAVQVKVVASSLSQTTLFQPKDQDRYDLKLSLRPLPLTSAKDGQLTISTILGDEETVDKAGKNGTTGWQGVVLVDGQQVRYGEEIRITSKRKPTLYMDDNNKHQKMKSTSFDDLKRLTTIHGDDGDDNYSQYNNDGGNGGSGHIMDMHQGNELQPENDNNGDNDGDQVSIRSSVSSSYSTSSEDRPTMTTTAASNNPFLGRGVVAAALGGVMFPFRNAFYPLASSPNALSLDKQQHDLTQNVVDRNTNKEIVDDNSTSKTTMESKRPSLPRSLSTDIDKTLPSMYEDGIVTSPDPMFFSDGTAATWRILWNFRMLLLIGLIGLCLIYVAVLLVLRPPLLVTLDGPIYSLCRMPWLNGWQLQIVLHRP